MYDTLYMYDKYNINCVKTGVLYTMYIKCPQSIIIYNVYSTGFASLSNTSIRQRFVRSGCKFVLSGLGAVESLVLFFYVRYGGVDFYVRYGGVDF